MYRIHSWKAVSMVSAMAGGSVTRVRVRVRVSKVRVRGGVGERVRARVRARVSRGRVSRGRVRVRFGVRVRARVRARVSRVRVGVRARVRVRVSRVGVGVRVRASARGRGGFATKACIHGCACGWVCILCGACGIHASGTHYGDEYGDPKRGFITGTEYRGRVWGLSTGAVFGD